VRREREVELQATNGVFSQAFACVVFVLSLSWQTVVGFYQGIEGGGRPFLTASFTFVCVKRHPFLRFPYVYPETVLVIHRLSQRKSGDRKEEEKQKALFHPPGTSTGRVGAMQ
jgi:hypothetical protein